MSLLDKKPGTGGKRSPPAEPRQEENQEIKAAMATVEILKAEIERKVSEVAAAVADAAAARAETAAERGRTDALRAQLMDEADACAKAEGALAAEQRVSEGLRAQLAMAGASGARLQGSLDQALIAAGKPTQVIVPPYEPPAYELDVVGRDVNERAKRIVLKPIKVEA